LGRRKLVDELRCFFGRAPHELPIVSRAFSTVDLPNLQIAIDDCGREGRAKMRAIGYTAGMMGSEGRLGDLIGRDGWLESARVGLVQYRMVDVDLDQRMQCLEKGIHLIDSPAGKIAAHVHRESMCANPSLELEVMTADEALAAAFIDEIRERAHRSNVYRGKVISIGAPQDLRQIMVGEGRTIAFHCFPAVSREEVILPDATMALIERNTVRFLQHAGALRRSSQSVKRGLLLHGKPGTSKTYTAKWLAQSMPGVTVILLTGEQLWLIKECCQLARLLAPSLVIMEDVDLIATERDERRHPAYQITLHQLLNEMDGLGSDAEVIFILTTNRPQAIEPALAARPGRIDQAIEFPLPDADCRRRLLDLYGRGLTLALADSDRLIARTEGASPAFIQELVRKAALFAAERNSSGGDSLRLTDDDFDEALRELLFGGGELTRNLLGFATDAGGRDGARVS
jgi:cell division protease FtsH